MRRFPRSLRRPLVEHLVALQLVPMAVMTRVALSRVELRRLLKAADTAKLAGSQRFPMFLESIAPQRLYALADGASWVVKGRRRCLVRSLLLYWLLRQRGQAPLLELGVAKNGTELLSHAWVSVGGRVVGEMRDVERSFKTIARLGAS